MAFMKLFTTKGRFVLLEVRGETHVVGPDLVDVDLLTPCPPGFPTDDRPAVTLDATEGCTLDAFIDATQEYWFDCGFTDDAAPIFARKAATEAWEEMLAGLQMYVQPSLNERTCDELTVRDCWAARYSAPGYLDATDWTLGDTEADAVADCREVYGSDEDEEADAEDPDTELAPTTPSEE